MRLLLCLNVPIYRVGLSRLDGVVEQLPLVRMINFVAVPLSGAAMTVPTPYRIEQAARRAGMPVRSAGLS